MNTAAFNGSRPYSDRDVEREADTKDRSANYKEDADEEVLLMLEYEGAVTIPPQARNTEFTNKRAAKRARHIKAAGYAAQELNEGFIHEGVRATQTGLDIPDGLPYATWEHMLQVLVQIADGIHWFIGDALNYGEAAYGEMYSQALEVTRLSYSYLSSVKTVARAVKYSARNPRLSFSHHAAVASLMWEHSDVAIEILKTAEREGLSEKEIRNDARSARVDLGMEAPQPTRPTLPTASTQLAIRASEIEGALSGISDSCLSYEGGRASTMSVGYTARGQYVDRTTGELHDIKLPRVDWYEKMMEIVLKLAQSDPDNCVEAWADAVRFVGENHLATVPVIGAGAVHPAHAGKRLAADMLRDRVPGS